MGSDDCGGRRRVVRGSTTVVGELLLVGVAILLAVIVATVVFDIGESLTPSAPKIQFDVGFEDGGRPTADDRLTITHEGGDSVPSDQLTVAVTDVSIGGGTTIDENYSATANWSNTTLTAGAALTIDDESDLVDAHGHQPRCVGQCPGSGLDLSRATLRIEWTTPASGVNVTLLEWTGPDA